MGPIIVLFHVSFCDLLTRNQKHAFKNGTEHTHTKPHGRKLYKIEKKKTSDNSPIRF
jgi:hypothetical protein